MTPFDLDATWRDSALCIGLHARFDPPTDRSQDEQARIHAARAICRAFPVTAPCIESAKLHGDSGVRGGVLLRDGHASRWPQEGPA